MTLWVKIMNKLLVIAGLLVLIALVGCKASPEVSQEPGGGTPREIAAPATDINQLTQDVASADSDIPEDELENLSSDIDSILSVLE